MLLIVAHHYAVHGEFHWLPSDFSISHLWYNFLTMGGRAGVNIFVLISGYYLIEDKSTSFKFKRIIKFWGECFFYSALIYIIFTACCPNTAFSIKSAIKVFFPITFGTWWFASTYFILYLLHPLINQLFINLNKQTYQKAIILFAILWSLSPMLTGRTLQCNSLLWFIYLYSIAAYLKLHGKITPTTPKVSILICAIFIIATYGSSVLIMILGHKYSFYAISITRCFDMQMLPTFIWSLALFIFFISTKPSHNSFINIIASCSFGVYLIHDHKLVRPYIWDNLFANFVHQGAVSIIPHSIIYVLAVYLSCTLIDLIRQLVFERPFLSIISKINFLSKPSITLYNKLRELIFGRE